MRNSQRVNALFTAIQKSRRRTQDRFDNSAFRTFAGFRPTRDGCPAKTDPRVRQKRRSSRDQDGDDGAYGDELAAVTDRLDSLTRQLERVTRSAGRRDRRVEADESDDWDDGDERDERSERYGRREADRRVSRHEEQDKREPDRVAEAIARLDRRLDQVIAEGRAAAATAARPPAYLPQGPIAPPLAPQFHMPQHAAIHQAAIPQAPMPPAMSPVMPPAMPPAMGPRPLPGPSASPANGATAVGPNAWAMEISARQRALDGEDAAPALREAAHPAPPQRLAGPDLSGLESHLRDITTQIASMHRPYEEALAALRSDLAEIGRALTEALPRRAIETLEHEVRALSERVDHIRQSSGGGEREAFTGLEHGLAEVRDALRGLTPAEGLVGVDEAVRGLSRKIDQISSSQQDPGTLRQIEHAITSLRGAVSHVASDGALAQLAAEVRGLASRFERVAVDGGAEAIAQLDQRISTLMETGRSVPPELENAIRTLSTQLERAQLTQGDQLALRGLEDRIVKLVEKLDASDARLSSLVAMERGIADLLVAVGELRQQPRALRSAPEPEPAPAPQLPPAAQLQMGHPAPSPAPVMAMPAPAPAPMPPAPVAVAPPPPPNAHRQDRPAPPARPEPRRPIDPHLPPDTPLEPGMGAPKIKPGSPAARIAASEAALGQARPPAAETGGKAAAIAAARNAARALAEAPAPVASSQPAKPKAKIKPKPAPEPQEPLLLGPEDQVAPPASSFRSKAMKHAKTLVIATSVVVIVLGALHTAMDLFMPAVSPGAGSQTSNERPAATARPAGDAAPRPAAPGRAMPAPEGTLPPPEQETPPAEQPDGPSSFFNPSTILQNLPRAPDITGSIGPRPRPTAPPAAAAITATNATANTAAVPSSASPALRAAAAAGNPAAEYEMGLRYAEGRSVGQDFAEAIRWLERAASSGFAPAQFRLAGLYEKGEGVRKDLNAARKLYLSAADKGHAKAMHNLAVLHAEGIDGKPDYKVAAQWFRRAAGYGVTDSQYNLAILYARGIGVSQNLAESYKWFALAAAGGDADATKKRDEVGARLDKNALMSAQQAAQTFVAEREPDEATNLRVPPGGWDRTATAAQPARPKARPSANAR